MSLKIISIEFEGLNHFKDGKVKIDFYATDKIFKNSELYKISDNIAFQNIIGFIGLNATGKTTILRLLRLALSVVIYNKSLNTSIVFPIVSEMVSDNTILRVNFFYQNIYYQLESIIGCRKDEIVNNDTIHYYYKEEMLKIKKMPKYFPKSKLTDFSTGALIQVQKRSALDDNVKTYLDDDKSFISPIIKGNGNVVQDSLILNYINLANTIGTTPDEILGLFDESIEKLTIHRNAGAEDNRTEWELRFKGENKVYHSPNMLYLNFIISTGTIRGQGLIQQAIEVLKTGGYLIVDELEMHLNKEIIKTFLNLFNSNKTNPHGATIIFATHYIELLDINILNRKDNIYITRKKSNLLSVSKFSDEFGRNDFKKSDIIFSNMLLGTAPKYENIQRLRDYICMKVLAQN